MSNNINKKACIFFAPLDTVLKQPALRYEPLLRFYALLNHHVVISDTQLLDNRLFRDDCITRNLEWLIRQDSGDGLPFVLVSQRNESQSLVDILLSMARGGKDGPMKFSSLNNHQQAQLHRVWERGKVTESSLENDAGYPVRVFARRATQLVRNAGYASELTWPVEVKQSQKYFSLFINVLKCDSLAIQAGIRTHAGREFLERTMREFGEFDPDSFSRTLVYREIDRRKQKAGKEKEYKQIPIDDIANVFGVIKAMADYAYLRNFADRSGFSFMLDNVHWLASSVVNAELKGVRPSAELVDDYVERCLDLQEGTFGGFGSSGHETLSTLLRRCGFSVGASWQHIIEMRCEASFWDRLRAIEESIQTGGSDTAIHDHLTYCFARLLGKQFDWESFVSNIFVGGIGFGGALAFATSPLWSGTTLAQAAIGFVTAGGGSVLTLGALHKYRNRKQAFLVDQITDSVVAGFERRRSG